MYKLKLMMMSLTLFFGTLYVGATLATMQDRTDTTTNQTNQNNSNRGNRNSNRNSNSSNNNSDSMMNMNSTNMDSNSMMNMNSMNMNSSNMNSNSMMSNTGMSSDGMLGSMTIEEFMRINAEGGAKVAAITPSNTALSSGDQKLMQEVAKGGRMQLEVSRAALSKVTSPEAKTLAQAEVDEQTGLAAKLQEIAAAKNVTLSTETDSKAQSMVSRMERLSGAELDRYYIRESGVKGHEKLEKTMSKVISNGSDDTLKTLASTALPLVRTHLQVSRSLTGDSNRNSNANSNSSSNRNSDSDTDSNRNSSGNSNRNTNSNSNSNRNSNGNSNGNSNSNRNSSNSNSNDNNR